MYVIVAGINSLNENLCSWLDGHLQPFMSHIPGLLKDTQQVLVALSDHKWHEGSVWIREDVVSL